MEGGWREGGEKVEGGREEEGEGRVVMHTTGGDSLWGGLFTMSTTVETVFVGQLIWRE